MIKAVDIKDRLYQCASLQQGLFTTKQAEEAGYRRSHHSYHVKSANWTREMRGIYRLPYFPQNNENAQLVLWYLWSRDRNEKPQGVYSHDTALRIYELSDLMPEKLHIAVPKSFRRFNKIPKILTLHKAELLKADTRLMQGFAVTTPARTILDLIDSKHLDISIIKQAYNEGLKKGMFPPKDEKKIKEAFNDK